MSVYTSIRILLWGVDRHLLPKLCLHQPASVYRNTVSAIYRPLHLSCYNNAIADRRGFLEIEESFFKKTMKKIKYFIIDRSRMKVRAYFLYETIADGIPYPQFFEEMNLPDTFNSWFLITELHVWMLMVKSMEFGATGRKTRNFIVEAMWADVSEKSKKLGVEHLSMARDQVHQMGQEFQAALLTYDEGLLTDDKVLASALWRRFFAKDCDEPQRVEKMVKYVRQQMLNLDKYSQENFVATQIKWLPLESTIT